MPNGDGPELSVESALTARSELIELVAHEPESVQYEILQDAYDDPSYVQGDNAVAILTNIATLIRRRVEESPAPTQATETSNQTHINELLADLEDQTHLEANAEQRKQDIDMAHGYCDAYSRVRQHSNGRPTNRQRTEIERAIKRGFRERWTAEELANEPDRMAVILDSLYCKEGIRPIVKDELTSFIAKEVATYVDRTAVSVDPEIIGKRLIACFSPSFCQEELKTSLLTSYFRHAEGRGAETVIDNYERFVRGILRTAYLPSVCQEAINIARCQTEILPEGKLYDVVLKGVSMIRVDRPDYFARTFACAKVLSLLDMHLGKMPSASVQNPNNPYRQMTEATDRILVDGFSQEDIDAIDRNYGRVFVTEAMYAATTLGTDVFNDRVKAMQRLVDLLSDQSHTIEEQISALSSIDEGGYNNTRTSMDIIVDAAVAEFPEQREFLEALLDTPSLAMDEMPLYIRDKSGLPDYWNHFSELASLDSAISSYTDQLAEEHGELSGIDMRSEISHLKLHSHRTDDGYIIETFLPSEVAIVTDADWQTIIATHEARFETAKNNIHSFSSMNRRHDAFGDPETGMMFVVRPESEHDRRSLHPLDAMLGHEAEDADMAAAQKRIDEARQLLIEERRRFLNERGIALYIDDEEAGIPDALGIEIYKHPRNPQYFVVLFNEILADGTRQHAKVLLDNELHFQLGDKKVHAEASLKELNAVCAEILAHFMCAEAVQTTEGTLSGKKNALTARIAHLRLLQDGENFSSTQWEKCLEIEGLDLEVLSKQQAAKYHTTRNSTYVRAVEKDDPGQGPLRLVLPE